ncbi:MAG: Ldh family oxidoreductase [Candidatus Shapirobacteria bacterium]
MKIKVSELKKIVDIILTKYKYNPVEVEIISEILMYAQLRGNNQGIVKLINQKFAKDVNAGEIEVTERTKLSVLINGNHNSGMVVLKKAMDRAIGIAKEHGFGIVGMNNTNSSTGAIGYYANEIAKQGLIGFVFAGSPETVNTHGSFEPIFGTNPLAIGMPSDGDPVVLDMATASMAYFGLIEAATAGKKIPEGIAYDENGNLTTDPNLALDGAIRPFDRSYKGAGLAMMIEILTGPLVAASFTGIGDTETNWGNLIYVIDPNLLVDVKTFKFQVSQMVEKVKSTKKLPGVDEIFVPGEMGNKLTKQNLDRDEIEIEDNLLNKLKEVVEN